METTAFGTYGFQFRGQLAIGLKSRKPVLKVTVMSSAAECGRLPSRNGDGGLVETRPRFLVRGLRAKGLLVEPVAGPV